MTDQGKPNAKELSQAAKVSRLVANESPRGLILVAATYADQILERLLRMVLAPGEETDKLLRPGTSAPLGSFSARTKMCLCLGLITEDHYWNLDQIRELRNYCAHHLASATFDDQKVRDRIANLRINEQIKKEPLPLQLAYALGMLEGAVDAAEPLFRRGLTLRTIALAAEARLSGHADTWKTLAIPIPDLPGIPLS